MTGREGKRVGNYCLERSLGRGGFAEVYLGEHIYLKTPAAIKLLHTTGADQKHLDGFLREAQAIAKLVHPHIVRVLEFGLDGETPFLVMDYAPNGTLRRRYSRKTQLPLTAILPYVKQVSAALQYAHDAKIIHRDVKPENMLLGRGNEVLLSDFGIALLAHSSSSLSTQEVAGTAAYMAPEQFQGKPRFASDQYALGLVVYEWLTGDLPFHGSFIELCTQHLFTPPPPLHEKVPTILPGVEEVILRALAKAPQDRYASVEEFAKELERAAVSSHPLSVTTTELPLTPKRPRSHQELSPHTPRRIVLKPATVSSHPASITIAEPSLTPMPLLAPQETPLSTPRPVQASTDEPGTSQFSTKEELPQDFFWEATHADTFSQIPISVVQEHTSPAQPPLMPTIGWRKRRHWRWIVLMSLLLVVSIITVQALGVMKSLVGLEPTPTPHGQVTLSCSVLSKLGCLGWHPTGHILSLAQDSDFSQGGSPSLKVTLSSRKNDDCPYVARHLSASDDLHASQRVRLSLYVPKGPVIIAAKVFALDGNSNWPDSHKSFVVLPQGVWYPLDYLLPSDFISPATQVGVQFVSHPLNVVGTVYIGHLEWEEGKTTKKA